MMPLLEKKRVNMSGLKIRCGVSLWHAWYWISGLFLLLAQPAWANETLPAEIYQKGFVYCTAGNTNILNPQRVKAGVTIDAISTQVYDRLLDINPFTYRLMPSAAESWQISDAGRTFTFKLRRGIQFHQTAWFTPTRALNADDVVFSLQRIFDPKSPYHMVGGGSYPYFDSLQLGSKIESITKLNDDEVQIKLLRPDSSFLTHLATHFAVILSKEYADQLLKEGKQEQIDRLPIGSGPFKLQEYRNGQYIRLARHDEYWKGRARIAQVVVDFASGGAGRMAKLITGECDVLPYPAANQIALLRDDPKLKLSVQSGMNVSYLALNTQKAPLNNPKVRRALSMLVNRDRLLKSIYYGTAEPARSLLPPVSWAFDHRLAEHYYTPAEAQKLLTEAGVSDLKLKLWVPTSAQSYNPSPLKMAELIQADMAKAGVKVSIISIDTQSFERGMLQSGDYDMVLTGWVSDSDDPDSFLRPQLGCNAIDSGSNYARWCEPRFDAFLHAALTTDKLASRLLFYRNALQIMEEETPVIPIAHSLRLQGHRADLNGLVLSPFGSTSFSEVYRQEPEQ